MKNLLIEITEKVISELGLPNDYETFCSVQDIVMECGEGQQTAVDILDSAVDAVLAA